MFHYAGGPILPLPPGFILALLLLLEVELEGVCAAMGLAPSDSQCVLARFGVLSRGYGSCSEETIKLVEPIGNGCGSHWYLFRKNLNLNLYHQRRGQKEYFVRGKEEGKRRGEKKVTTRSDLSGRALSSYYCVGKQMEERGV
jgi:hypothetical protein